MKTQSNIRTNKRATWPQIRKTTHSNGTTAYMVDGRIAGKGERFFFKSRIEAQTKAEQLRATRKNHGAEAMAMPQKLRVEAVECAQRLAKVGGTLTEAVDYFIRHAKPEAGAKTAAAVIADFLRVKEQAGRRAGYIYVQKCVLGYFAATFGGREIHTISHAEISDWMGAQSWALRTRENYRRDLGNLFGFAMKHGHCASNPLARMERATLDDKPPGILTIAQTAALLTTAETFEGGAFLPYVAIGLFAGLRASELAALDWSEVSLTERTIEVTAAKAKTRARRIVTMSENLAAWLTPYASTAGAATPKARAASWARLRAVAGITPWPKNAMRHSFASYHVAKHHDAPRTSLEMGHDNPQQLFTNYRELVKPTDADRFWKLTPTAGGNVVPMTAAA